MDEIKEEIYHDGSLLTIRIPVSGGYIYNSFDKGNKVMSGVFVPDNIEIKQLKADKKYLFFALRRLVWDLDAPKGLSPDSYLTLSQEGDQELIDKLRIYEKELNQREGNDE